MPIDPLAPANPRPRPGILPRPPAGPAACWIDVYAQPDFAGERRRLYGPAQIDSALLGDAGLSVRVGPGAQLRVAIVDDAGSHIEELAGDETAARLRLAPAGTLEIMRAIDRAAA